MYHFTPAQANVLSAPVGVNMFADLDKVYSRDNASSKTQHGTSTVDAMNYEAASRQFFNDTLALGVDCGRLNSATGRPNVGFSGSACYPASMSVQRAAKTMDSTYSAYGPTAEQIVLAQGDVRYAASRYADQNNYNELVVSDENSQPQLLGTRDAAPSGCVTTLIDQTYGNVSTCALASDPLPYPTETGDSPHTEYWSPLELGDDVPEGCLNLSPEATMCNLNVMTTHTVDNAAVRAARSRVQVPAHRLSPQHRQRS
jgi:hypothetical protein